MKVATVAHRGLLVAVFLAAACPSHAQSVVTLEEACASADGAHEKIRAAQAAEEAAAVAPWRAVSVMGPSIVDSPAFLQNKEEIAFPTSAPVQGFNPVVIADHALRNTLSIVQPLYTHQFWALRDLGKAEVQRTAEATRAARLDVRLAVTAAYYDVLRAQILGQVAGEAERLAEAEFHNAKTRLELGSALKVDVVRADTEIARARQRVAEASGAIDAARVSLARLANLPTPFTVAEPPRRVLKERAVDGLLDIARTKSPDLQQARAALKASDAEERRRVAALYPTVGLRWNYFQTDHETFAERNNFWTLQIGIEVPLVDAGGARYLDIAEQRAKVRSTTATVAGFERDLMVDVEKAFVTVRTLAAQEEAANKEADLADETYHLLSEQYRAGASTSLDVLSALNARTAAQSNRAGVHYGYAVALAQLDRLTGRADDATNSAGGGR